MVGLLKLVLVCVMFCPLVIPVVVVPNCIHDPVLLLHHVAVMVCDVSASEQTTYSVGFVCMFMVLLVGASLFCVGMLLVVKLYVVLVQLHPSVKLTDQ